MITTMLDFNEAEDKAKQLHPVWLAVDKDMHICAFTDKPICNAKLGHWMSDSVSFDLGFYKGCIAWTESLRPIR